MKNKIENLLILTLCFLYFFIRGKANKKVLSPKSVLVFHSGKMGDMVCATPIFHHIKDKYPDCKVYVFGDGVNNDLLKYNKDVDEYIVFKKGEWLLNAKKIREISIDFACSVTPGFINLASLYLAGVPAIASPIIVSGWSPYETRAYRLLLSFVIPIKHNMGKYAPGENLRLLEPINIYASSTKKHLSFSKEADLSVQDSLKNSGILKTDFVVGISPSAGNKIKDWPAERFAEVANYLYKKYKAKIIIIGTKRDENEVRNMISKIETGVEFCNFADRLNIDGLKSLISKMNLFISVDTGPIYIAEAFGVPTVDITGPIDEFEQPPIGKFNRVVSITNRKKPELYVLNASCYDYKEARRQVEEITVEMVLDCVDSIFKELNYDKKNT